MANLSLTRWAGVEMWNQERLRAYLANGISPQGAEIDAESCDGLAAAVYAGTYSPYRTPLLDEPPWYDAADPDTWDFAGLLPLEVTGLDDSTRTVEVIPTLSGDGLPGRVNRAPRAVGVTAVLVGKTTESVYAGLAWLQRVLQGECDADEQPCGPSGTLEFFTACPVIAPSADLDANPIVSSYEDPNAAVDPSSEWQPVNAAFTEEAPDGGTVLVPFDTVLVLDGGDADDPYDEEVDGGPAGGGGDYYDGGAAETVGTGLLAVGEPRTCTSGPVKIEWFLYVETDDEVANVEMVILDDAGTIVVHGPKVLVDVDSPFPLPYSWDLPFGVDEDGWRPGIIADGRVVVEAATVEVQPLLGIAACVDPYRRYLPVTTTTSGPTVIDVVDTGCVQMLTVEWVWVSGSPYRYGVTEPMLSGLSWHEEPTFAAPGVTWDDGPPSVGAATSWNCAPLAPVASCAIDPLAPTFGTPPTVPNITDPLRPRITTQNVRTIWANIGPEQTPSNEGVLTFQLATDDDPVVGARVRVYDTADAAGVVPDKCDFVYEFLIDYIPANGLMTIDGTSRQISTFCAGNPVTQNSAAGVRGAYGGPVVEPVVRCDRRYFVLIQWLDTYPRTASGFYTIGDPEGNLTVDLAITTREG